MNRSQKRASLSNLVSLPIKQIECQICPFLFPFSVCQKMFSFYFWRKEYDTSWKGLNWFAISYFMDLHRKFTFLLKLIWTNVFSFNYKTKKSKTVLSAKYDNIKMTNGRWQMKKLSFFNLPFKYSKLNLLFNGNLNVDKIEI